MLSPYCTIQASLLLLSGYVAPHPFFSSGDTTDRIQFTLLGKDIRKVPAATVLPRRRDFDQHSCPGSASTEQTSASTNSAAHGRSSNGSSSSTVDTPSASVADMLESSPLKPPTKRKRKRRGHLIPKSINQASHPQQRRYWNEFDDGDEASELEAYVIFASADTTRGLPGTAAISRLAGFFASYLSLSTENLKQWLRPPLGGSPNNRPLLPRSQAASDLEALSSPIDDNDAPTRCHPHTKPTYSTFPAFKQPDSQAVQNRDSLLLRLAIASLGFSFATIFIAAALASSARRKAHWSADLGILVGVIAALTATVTGLALSYSREASLGRVWRVLLLLVFVAVCWACGELLAVVGRV